MQTVEIRCKAAVNIDLADLTPLQGDLKELSESNFNKLKQSILRHGITFPFFVWQSSGENYILDGTQRDRVLTKMAQEGFHIPALPCALIEAKDKREAAEKILLISSQYGRMTEESLDEFLAENDLSFLELADELELPSIDDAYFKDPSEFSAAGEDEQGRLDQKKPVKCPECGHQFIP
jgi:ParB-like chromosome segregation protein Spo0J